MVNNPESLRIQLIDAMRLRFGDKLAESVFDHDLWPVLQAAMKNGELLVSRNTAPEQKPVHKAIMDFMEGFLMVSARVKASQHVISKSALLKIVLQTDENLQKAMTDAKALPF